jgi:hypothetical protein
MEKNPGNGEGALEFLRGVVEYSLQLDETQIRRTITEFENRITEANKSFVTSNKWATKKINKVQREIDEGMNASQRKDRIKKIGSKSEKNTLLYEAYDNYNALKKSLLLEKKFILELEKNQVTGSVSDVVIGSFLEELIDINEDASENRSKIFQSAKKKHRTTLNAHGIDTAGLQSPVPSQQPINLGQAINDLTGNGSGDDDDEDDEDEDEEGSDDDEDEEGEEGEEGEDIEDADEEATPAAAAPAAPVLRIVKKKTAAAAAGK